MKHSQQKFLSDFNDSSSESFSNKDENSDIISSQSTHHLHHSHCQKKVLGVKINKIKKLLIHSTLQEWSDWRDDLKQLFQNNPDWYDSNLQKIDKALNFVDTRVHSLWKEEVQHDSVAENCYVMFIKWSWKTINDGTNSALSLYEMYDEAV